MDLPRAQRRHMDRAAVRDPVPVAMSTDEDAAAAHGVIGASGGEVEQLGGDHHRGIGLQVPEREGPLQRVHAEAVRALETATHVGRLHREPAHTNVPYANRVARQQEHLPARAHPPQRERAEVCDGCVVQDRDLVLRAPDGHVFQDVVLRQPHASRSELERAATQTHPRRERDASASRAPTHRPRWRGLDAGPPPAARPRSIRASTCSARWPAIRV